MPFQPEDVARVPAALLSLLLLDAALVGLAVLIRDNLPAIRAALRGDPIPPAE